MIKLGNPETMNPDFWMKLVFDHYKLYFDDWLLDKRQTHINMNQIFL